MTIFAVTRGRVENRSILGFKQTAEQVQGCKEIAPGDYCLSHGLVEMDVAVGLDDSVSVATNFITRGLNAGDRGLNAGDLEFGGSRTVLSSLAESHESLKVIPRYGKAALKIGPNAKGITLSLERHASVSVAPVAIGTIAIESAIKPAKSKAERSATFGGGRGSG